MVEKKKCVMCGNEGTFLVDAKYKDGTIQETLCEECFKINKSIIKTKCI